MDLRPKISSTNTTKPQGDIMIVLGIILILLGLFVASIKFLLWIGIVLLVVGLILNLVPIGGSRRRVF